jgi:hypothetical protein
MGGIPRNTPPFFSLAPFWEGEFTKSPHPGLPAVSRRDLRQNRGNRFRPLGVLVVTEDGGFEPLIFADLRSSDETGFGFTVLPRFSQFWAPHFSWEDTVRLSD